MIWEFTTTIKAHVAPRLWRNRLSVKKKLAEKRAKKQAKSGNIKEKKQDKTIPLDQIITLDHLTNPDKK